MPDRRPRLVPAPVALLGAVTLVVAVVGVVIGQAASPYAAGDPGAVVRWGLPVTSALQAVAASLTVGFLVLGAFVIPETTRTRRRALAAKAAAAAGAVWVLALLAQVVLGFADLAGLPLSSPGLVSQLLSVVWELPILRMSVISAVIVAAVALAAAGSESKAVLAWSTFGAWLALLPLALTGHAAASLDHMTGVNALGIHLLAATTWVGGLVALVAMARGLGDHLATTLTRYSVIAGWCFVGVISSGLLLAWTNIGDLANLRSRYGLLLGLKLLLAIALGTFGWWHRRTLIARVRASSGSAGFAPFVLSEIAVMSAAFGIGAAISRTPTPTEVVLEIPSSPVYALSGYPDPGSPDGGAWVTAWQTEWLWLAIAIVAVYVYLRWVIRLRRRGDAWPVLRTISWVLGWATFVYATSAAPGVYGRVSFSWHMVEHMTVAMIVPLLLVPGAPITLALRALPARRDKTMGPRELILALVHSRYLGLFANPAVAASVFFFSLAIFYYSPLFELAMRTHTGHVLMMVHFLLSGYVFTWVLIGIDPGPKRWPPLALLVVLFVTISFHAFFGVVLTRSTTLLAPEFFGVLDLPWVPDPMADQRSGGEIAWGVGEVPTLILAVAVAWQWMRSDERETRRKDRAADRDGDAELAAYNAHLAALRERDERPPARR